MTPPVRFHFVSPGPLDQPTGGYRYDKRILEKIRDKGADIILHELPGQFPGPEETARSAAAQVWDRLGPDDRLVIDGLALPAFEQPITHRSGGPRLIILMHHPLFLETGRTPEEVDRLRRCETALLQAADRIVVTSPATHDEIAALGVDASTVRVVVPGTDRARAAAGSTGGSLSLLCVAALIPRKGHLLLLSALSAMRHLRWHLDCVGPTDRDPAHGRAVRDAIDHAWLTDRVTLCGTLSEAALAERYGGADLFVLASRYEGYGMAYAEALAHGLPIVASGDGAVRDTVPPTAGLVVPAGDRLCLTAALATVMGDPRLRNRLCTGARRAGRSLPDWDGQADRFLAAVLK